LNLGLPGLFHNLEGLLSLVHPNDDEVDHGEIVAVRDAAVRRGARCHDACDAAVALGMLLLLHPGVPPLALGAMSRYFLPGV